MKSQARLIALLSFAMASALPWSLALSDGPVPIFAVGKVDRTFGDVRIVVGAIRDTDGLPEWPEMFVGDTRTAIYPGFQMQAVYASPDGRYFLGVSNLGYSEYALALLDRTGAILVSKKHDTGELHYCRQSVSNLREWVDLAAARVRFDIRIDSSSPSNGYVGSVTIQGCDGKDVVVGLASSSQ